jgi:hypothetical protein
LSASMMSCESCETLIAANTTRHPHGRSHETRIAAASRKEVFHCTVQVGFLIHASPCSLPVRPLLVVRCFKEQLLLASKRCVQTGRIDPDRRTQLGDGCWRVASP